MIAIARRILPIVATAAAVINLDHVVDVGSWADASGVALAICAFVAFMENRKVA